MNDDTLSPQTPNTQNATGKESSGTKTSRHTDFTAALLGTVAHMARLPISQLQESDLAESCLALIRDALDCDVAFLWFPLIRGGYYLAQVGSHYHGIEDWRPPLPKGKSSRHDWQVWETQITSQLSGYIKTPLAVISTPLDHGARRPGRVLACWSETQTISALQRAALRTLAQQIGLLIRLYRNMHRNKKARNAITIAATKINRLETVHQASQAVTSELDLSTLLGTTLDKAMYLLGAKGSCLYTYHADSDSLHMVAARGLLGKEVGLTLQRGEGAAGRTLLTGQPVVVRDYAHWQGRAQNLSNPPLGGVIQMPLRSGDKIVGVLGIADDHPRDFTTENIQLLSVFSTYVAIALDNSQLLDRERKRAAQLEVVWQVGRKISSLLIEEEIYDTVVQEIQQTFGYYSVAAFRYEPDKEVLSFYSGIGDSGERAQHHGIELPLTGRGIIATTAREGSTIVCADSLKDPRFLPHPLVPDTRSELAVPLKQGENLVGVLDIQSRTPNNFDRSDISLVETLADQIVKAIHHARLYREEMTQRRISETLQEVARILNSTLELSSLLNLVLDQLGRVVHFDSSALLLLEGSQSLRIAAHIGLLSEEMPEKGIFALGYSEFFQRILTSRQPYYLPHLEAGRYRKTPHPQGLVESVLGLPLLAKGEAIGLLVLRSDRPDAYTPFDIKLALAFTEQAGLAVENAQLFEQERYQRNQLTQISALTRRVTATFDLNSLLHEVVIALHREFEFFNACIFLMHESAQEVVIAANAGAYNEVADKGYRQSVREGVIGRAVRTGKVQVVNDVSQDPDFLMAEGMRPYAAELCVPLISGNEVLGILGIQHETAGAFTPSVVSLIKILADQLTVAVQNSRLYHKTKMMAQTDGLTGLYNSHYFYEELERELQRTGRYAHKCSLIFFDIDDFKRYNDAFGHLMGDELLQALAGLIKDLSRTSDTVARYGGEEFAIILPETDQGQAGLMAERLWRAVREAKFTVGFPPRPTNVTISVGVATFPEDAIYGKDLVHAADIAVYVAKRRKDQVVIYGGGRPKAYVNS
ncbi:MAG: GAF domain-containing protein [Chloroflexi bacterium]|nr:GAF domain-containing protein [Chloroflexota bacterium]